MESNTSAKLSQVRPTPTSLKSSVCALNHFQLFSLLKAVLIILIFILLSVIDLSAFKKNGRPLSLVILSNVLKPSCPDINKFNTTCVISVSAKDCTPNEFSALSITPHGNLVSSKIFFTAFSSLFFNALTTHLQTSATVSPKDWPIIVFLSK